MGSGIDVLRFGGVAKFWALGFGMVRVGWEIFGKGVAVSGTFQSQ